MSQRIRLNHAARAKGININLYVYLRIDHSITEQKETKMRYGKNPTLNQ